MLNQYTITIIAFIALLVLNGCENYAERTHESWIEAPSGVAYDDSTIHARIAYAINTDSELQGANIEIKVDQGKVLLTGTAANHNQITRLNMLSWMVDGVKDVDIQISPQ
ncbi:MAG: BON domain-containing protein [Nitrosomonas sp.]|nr:BON domain-containing protein [Nitrosomonas sp.]MCP5251343.1 BON domain-containing protein [Burkholderiales bacterium]MDR4519273.1 BON domain-containing protein [Nitrosomonas sp.]HQU62537.1 BON domain-containing protein [Nitrosomonas sp.]